LNLFLVDGSALFYRSYFAFIRNPLLNSRGENVSAVFGFANSLLKILRDHRPDLLAVAFDCKEPTFRHEIFPEYKAHREKMPDDLIDQLPDIFEFVERLGVGRVSLAGYEADDVIGTLSRLAEEKGLNSWIVTGDKDFLQLLGPRTRIVNLNALSKPTAPRILDTDYVRERYGFEPRSVIDYLALTGDASDNIPGVAGIGDKTARKLLARFEKLEAIYAELDRVESKSVRNRLEKGKESAFLSRDLAAIRTDLPLDVDREAFAVSESLPSNLGQWFERMEFASLSKYVSPAADFPKTNASDEDAPDDPLPEVAALETPGAFRDWIAQAGEGDVVAVLPADTPEGEPCLVFRCKDRCAMVEIERLARDDGMAREMNALFADSGRAVCGIRAKEVLGKLLGAGARPDAAWFDAGLAGFLLDPEKRNPGLRELSERYLFSERKTPRIPSAVFERSDPASVAHTARCCLALHGIFTRRLEEEGMASLFHDIEVPMVRVLAKMEHEGVLLDSDLLRRYKEELDRELARLEETVTKQAGEEFNLNSPRQLGSVLFEKLEIQKRLGIRKVKKTKTGYSTASESLSAYRSLPLVRAVLRHRALAKLRNTYLDSLIERVDPMTGRLHAHFNQMVTVTGRLSSNHPNLQNIPIRTPDGARIRQAFRAAPRCVLLSADYSQIELRILAHLSGDPRMIEAFEKERDIHAETASRLFQVPIENVTDRERARAKAVNFGVVYGMGPFRLSRDLEMPLREATRFIEHYFSVYEGVKRYLENEIERVRETGVTRTLFGRTRALPDIRSSRKDKRIQAERLAANTPIQGTAADLIKAAMVSIQRVFEKRRFAAKMLIQIHDELLFEVPREEKDPVEACVRGEMENVARLRVPLTVHSGFGATWLEAH
jgi:DNA polymerase-1